MGNAPITVGLRTEKASYKAGGRVKGTVYVSVNKQAQPAHTIMLWVIGREHALVHYTTSETREDGREVRTHSHDHYDESNCEFLKMEYPLHQFPAQQLPPGQYEFPFYIQLPINLPSSMYCKQGESRCSVEYLLTATVVKPSSGIFSVNPSSEQKLNIFAAPSPDENVRNTALTLPMQEVPMNSCCCHYKGVMTLQAQFSKTTVQPRDTIDVMFRCQNQSTLTVKIVRVQLKQVIEWNTHGCHNEVVKRVLDRRDMDASQFPELTTRHRRQRQYFGVPEQEPFHGGSGWNRASIQVPPMIQDSYNGRSIKVRHLVSVQLLTKGCCTTEPDATTMITVYQSLPTTASGFTTEDPLKDPTSTVPTAPSPLYGGEFPNTGNTLLQPSAPPGHWDGVVVTSVSPVGWEPATQVYDGAAYPPVAEAQALPLDWNAQTAEVVTIPMAEAMILDSSWQQSSSSYPIDD